MNPPSQDYGAASTDGHGFAQTAAALVVVFVAEVGARLLFQFVPVVPYFIEFNPGVALVPASGYFLGPAGAFASLAATVLADHWTGLWSVLSLFKAAGIFAMALSAWALRSSGPFSMAGFIVTGLVSLFAASVWTGVGAEALRIYPFTYVSSLLLVHNAVFFLLLAPGLWSAGKHVRPIAGGSPSARAQIAGGAIGACVLGILISAGFYGMWPFERYHLSDHAGLALVLCVTPLLALHAIGLGRACFTSGR
jgi:hypothetical protein